MACIDAVTALSSALGFATGVAVCIGMAIFACWLDRRG